MPATSKSQHSAKTKSAKSSPSGKKHSRKPNPLLAELPTKITPADLETMDPELRDALETLIVVVRRLEDDRHE